MGQGLGCKEREGGGASIQKRQPAQVTGTITAPRGARFVTLNLPQAKGIGFSLPQAEGVALNLPQAQGLASPASDTMPSHAARHDSGSASLMMLGSKTATRRT